MVMWSKVIKNQHFECVIRLINDIRFPPIWLPPSLGGYMLVEPDGSTRIVEYYADSVNGFNANVRTIDAPLFYGGGGIDNDLMMMDQKLLEKQKMEIEMQQKLELGQQLGFKELELQKLEQQLEIEQKLELQQLQLQQQMQMQVVPEQFLKGGATGFSYSNQVVHH